MITQADAIFAEADLLAGLQNGLVVTRAVQESKRINPGCHFCTCNYQGHASAFRGWLHDYSLVKINISQEQRRLENGGDEGNRNWLMKLEHDAERLRNCLSSIWPCPSCILQFNPTGKDHFCGEILDKTDALAGEHQTCSSLPPRKWMGNRSENGY